MNRYSLRRSANGAFIDLIHTGDGPGTGALCRVPVRDGRSELAQARADLICRLLNEWSLQAHGTNSGCRYDSVDYLRGGEIGSERNLPQGEAA